MWMLRTLAYLNSPGPDVGGALIETQILQKVSSTLFRHVPFVAAVVIVEIVQI